MARFSFSNQETSPSAQEHAQIDSHRFWKLVETAEFPKKGAATATEEGGYLTQDMI